MRFNLITCALALANKCAEGTGGMYPLHYSPKPYSFLDRMGVDTETGCVWLDEVSDMPATRKQQFNLLIRGW